jgi:hypothetical protein
MINEYIPKYKTNSYIDKMFCQYCKKCSNCNEKYLCLRCGKNMFGNKTINKHTLKIPPKINYSYINSIFPSNYPYIYYYGSLNGKLINYY